MQDEWSTPSGFDASFVENLIWLAPVNESGTQLRQLRCPSTGPVRLTYQLIDIAVAQKSAHPRLPNRVTGKVRAVLTETRDGREQRHELAIPVWANTSDTMSEEDIDMALLVKAADILGRLKAKLDLA